MQLGAAMAGAEAAASLAREELAAAQEARVEVEAAAQAALERAKAAEADAVDAKLAAAEADAATREVEAAAAEMAAASEEAAQKAQTAAKAAERARERAEKGAAATAEEVRLPVFAFPPHIETPCPNDAPARRWAPSRACAKQAIEKRRAMPACRVCCRRGVSWRR
eukprot:6848674-Prymnesium_polylepis.1